MSKDNRISYSEFLALWENKHENDRLEQIAELGSAHQLSCMDMSYHLGGDSSLDVAAAAEARASFIHEKHKPDGGSKHVGFSDTLVHIDGDTAPQQILGSSPGDIGLPL